MTPAQRVAAVLAAAAVAVPTIAVYEGYVPYGYADPGPLGVKLPTACYGSTKGIVLGKKYTAQQCADMLAADAVTHGLEIAPCLPDNLPIETRAAFTSFGFNVGTAAFCKSTLSRKALAGDLRGACAELSKWTKSAGREMRGLVRRRAAERELCERGLK
jgi:lysozyme